MSIRDPQQAYTILLDWLFTRSLEGWVIPDLLGELTAQSSEWGMPLYRAHIGMPVLHPLHVVGAYTWYRERGVEVETV